MPLVALNTADALDRLAIGPEAVGILPVAATEPHGPHLPLSTDCDIAEGHLDALPAYLESGLSIVVLPLERVGASSEHSAFPGCESRDFADLHADWFGIARRFARQGGRRLVIVSSHGGNTPVVDALIVSCRVQLEMLAVGTGWLRFGHPPGLFSEAELRQGIHGGAVETALMLHYAPGKVTLPAARDFPSALEAHAPRWRHLSTFGRHRFGWMSQDLNPAGVVGDARIATASMGAASADHQLRGFAELVAEAARFDLSFFRKGAP